MYKIESLVVHESKKILIYLIGPTYFMHKSLGHIKIPGRKGVTVIDEE